MNSRIFQQTVILNRYTEFGSIPILTKKKKE